MEWLNLSVRWVHMITGVAWIGASFYFVWLENNLNRVNPKDGLAGDLWAIHGGGIYHLEKYKLAPPTMPDNLHWFKWEAYFTWMSGIALLCVVFYANPTLYLLAPGSSTVTNRPSMPLPPPQRLMNGPTVTDAVSAAHSCDGAATSASTSPTQIS